MSPIGKRKWRSTADPILAALTSVGVADPSSTLRRLQENIGRYKKRIAQVEASGTASDGGAIDIVRRSIDSLSIMLPSDTLAVSKITQCLGAKFAPARSRSQQRAVGLDLLWQFDQMVEALSDAALQAQEKADCDIWRSTSRGSKALRKLCRKVNHIWELETGTSLPEIDEVPFAAHPLKALLEGTGLSVDESRLDSLIKYARGSQRPQVSGYTW